MTEKVAILGDLHIGVKGASKHHHSYMLDVLNDFFDYLDTHDIKTVIQAGDLFDDRKSMNLWAWNFFDQHIQPKIESMGLTWYQIVGNHDSHYRDSLEINSPRLGLSDHPNVTVIDEPTEVCINGDVFLLVPWINKTNQSAVEEAIQKSEAKYVCGHFEFDGFDLYRGQPAKSHFKHSIFSKFDRVYSGHYHTFSTKDNVVYTGVPYELTWQDCADVKYFLVHSGESYDLVPTKRTIYQKLRYDPTIDISSIDIAGKYVRVIVYSRPDKLKFNSFIHSLEQLGPYDLKIQETFADELSDESSSVDIKDTRDVIVEYLENSQIDLNKERVLLIFDDLYNQAMMQYE